MSMHPVTPVRPPAPYLGGKKRLAPTICERIDQIPHRVYIEPFVGMGGVFFRRRSKPKMEVINDLNGEIVNLFRILQRHYPQFIETLKYQLNSRREFERLRATDPATLTDLERAGRFLYLQQRTFGGRVDDVFGVSASAPRALDLTTIASRLTDLHERLEAVVFENLDWSELIRRYDVADALFYLDPPYFGGESDYGKSMFNRKDFARMSDQLSAIKGAFLLSINDTPEIRETFNAFHLDEVRLNYSVSRGSCTKASELIISNREVRPGLL